MPYNNTAIPPRREPTGQTILPLTRVKKIIALDPDILVCSNNAAFVITLATELFIQHLTEEAHRVTKLERKPRRNIQYRDLAQAVSRKDNLEFLEDLIPKTVPYKDVKARAATTRAMVEGGGKIKNGDSTGTTGADDAPKAGQASSAEASTSRQRENQATMRDMLLRQGGESRRSVTNGGDSSSAVNGHGHHHSSRPSGSFGGGRSGLLNAANGNSSNGTAAAENDESGDPSAQLQLESEAMNDRQAGRRGRRQDQDVEMTG